MAVVVGVSVPEGLALLLGPSTGYPQTWIWGPPLNPMTARSIAGLYLSVAIGFAMVWRETEWEKVRLPLAMLWTFALTALASAVVSVATDPAAGSPQAFIHLDRPFTAVWFALYAISVLGGFYYHVVHPRAFGAKAF